MLTRPAAWRATVEIERLRRAQQLRRLVNGRNLSDQVNELKTRTLLSLINDIASRQAAS